MDIPWLLFFQKSIETFVEDFKIGSIGQANNFFLRFTKKWYECMDLCMYVCVGGCMGGCMYVSTDVWMDV